MTETANQNPDQNQHITDYLEYYINKEESADSAVLLTGDWGCGKTYFIDQFIENEKTKDNKKAKDEHKKYIFKISLFGLKTIADLDDQIGQEIYYSLGAWGQGARILGNTLKTVGTLYNFLNPIANINTDELDKISKEASEKLKDFLFNKNKKQIILVLDDLERTAIPLKELLGHINAFVERDHIKVILIANENELIKEYTAQEETDKKPEQFISEDDRKNYEIYNIFKEKIIGKTFEIQSNFDNILNHFLEDYPYKEILLPHIDILKTIYSRHDVRNFRQLKQSLDDFAYLLSHLDEKHVQHEEFLAHLISNFFTLKLAIYKKDLDQKTLKKLIQDSDKSLYVTFLLNLREDDAKNSINNLNVNQKKILKCYQDYSLYSLLFPGNLYLQYNILFLNNFSNIKYAVNQLTYFSTEQQPLWMQCYRFEYLDEDKFQKLSQDILKNFDNLQDEDYYEYLHIIGLLTQWSKDQLITKTIDEITETANRFLKQYSPNWPDQYSEKWKNFQHYQSGFDHNNWTNRGFHSSKDQNFQQIERLFQEKQQKAVQIIKKREKEKQNDIVLNTIQNENINDLQELFLNNHDLDHKPIFHTIRQKDFLNSLSNLASHKVANLNVVLESRYLSNRKINDRPTSYYMTAEFTFWNDIKNCLETELSKQSNEQSKSLRNYNLENLLKIIQKITQAIFPFFTIELLKQNDYDSLKNYLCDCEQYGQYVVFNEVVIEDFQNCLRQLENTSPLTPILLERYESLTNTDVIEQEYKFWQKLQKNSYNPSPALIEMIKKMIQIIEPKVTQQTSINL